MKKENGTELLRITASVHEVGLMESTRLPGVVLMTDQGRRVEVPTSQQQAVRVAGQMYEPVELVVRLPAQQPLQLDPKHPKPRPPSRPRPLDKPRDK